VSRLTTGQRTLTALAFTFGLALAGCSEKERSDGSLAQGCPPNGSAAGKETKIAHPIKPSECRYGAVLMCNACVYDAEGRLSHSVSDPCGVCFRGSF
jgi:hypothetical protein